MTTDTTRLTDTKLEELLDVGAHIVLTGSLSIGR